MIRESASYTVPLTRELATEWTSLAKWDGERPLRNRVELLESYIDSGAFHSVNWSKAHWDGRWWRTDGQASSLALATRNGNFPSGLHAHITEFHCDTRLDLAELFSRFDAPGSVRTKSEIVNSHATVHEVLKEISPRKISACLSGIVASGNEGNKRRSPADEQARLIHHNLGYLLWAAGFASSRILERSPIMAAVFTTYNVDRDDAARFWTLVRDNSHENVKHPTRILHDLLVEVSHRGLRETDRKGNNRDSKWGPRALFVKCAHAWNAHRKGTSTDLKYYSDSPSPKWL